LLSPRETRALDLRKLRDAQEPGYQGVRIPAGATDGSVLWIRLQDVPVMGRLVVMQRHKGIASNYDCYICDCDPDFFDLYVDPASNIFLPDQSALYEALARFREHCNNYQWPYYVDASSWESFNPPVATIDGGGTATGHAAWPHGYTIGPDEALTRMSAKERFQYLADRLPQMLQLGWIEDQATMEWYRDDLKAGKAPEVRARTKGYREEADHKRSPGVDELSDAIDKVHNLRS